MAADHCRLLRFTRASDATLYAACLRMREELLWSQEQPPLTIAAYEQADAEATFFAAVVGNDDDAATTVIGTAMLHGNRIRQVVVAESNRGRSVGQELIGAVATAAREAGHDELHVSAWAASQPFYSKCKFATIGEPYVSNGIECQKMVLALT